MKIAIPERKPLILVDGSSYLFRAYHALPRLATSKGVPTGAIFGVLNMLRKLMREHQPEKIAIVFDPKGKSFRNQIYPQYKANRSATPDELVMQIEPLYETIEALGFPLIIVDGVEADDVIGTLAHQASQLGLKTLISTVDKDLAQLVNEDVTLVNTMNDHYLTPTTVKEKFGIPPEKIVEYFALVGDAIDNIPGIPKVGPKTAAKWLEQYGSLDNIVEHAHEISGKVGEYLRENLALLPVSKELATIKLDVPLNIEPLSLTPKTQNTIKLIELFKNLEFKSWLDEVMAEAKISKQESQYQYETIYTQEALSRWINQLSSVHTFAFDTETTSLESMRAELVGLSFSIKPGEAAYVPLMHNYEGAPEQLNRNEVLAQLKPILQNPQKKLIGQNIKYDLEILKHYDISVQAQICDTLLESYVLNSTSSRHDLDTLAFKYLGESMITFEEVAGKGAKQVTFNLVPIEKAAQYAAEDADMVLRLHEKLWNMIEEQPASKKVLMEIEWPLIRVLTEMEYNGVLMNATMLNQQSQELENRLVKLEKEVYQLAGHEFNLSSPKQLQFVLYEKLKLPILAKTPTGQPSTAENVLQELAFSYELPKLILEYRSLSKLKSTYTDALPKQINPKTGRVHTSYNQTITSTGRLSSTAPNLQNIPIRTEEGRRIRQAFIAPVGYKILAADYSQIELRLMAHLSQDPGLIKAFEKGLDIHRATASEVFGVPVDEVTTEMRRRAKAINFGLIYGMSSFGLSQALGIDRHQAQAYIDIYFARYPKVLEYMDSTRKQAVKNGSVETIFGRRLYIPEIMVSNLQRRKAAERAAINAPLQGSAADIIKLAMIAIHHWIQQSHIDVKMIMQVHDELVFEVAQNEIETAQQKIKQLMENSSQLSVPLVVDIGVGNNWDEAH